VRIPSARSAALALHLVAEAQKLMEQAELKLPPNVVPQLLRELAARLEETERKSHEEPASPSA